MSNNSILPRPLPFGAAIRCSVCGKQEMVEVASPDLLWHAFRAHAWWRVEADRPVCVSCWEGEVAA